MKSTMISLGQNMFAVLVLAAFWLGRTNAATKEEQYKITNPSIDFNGPSLMINFTVSDFISNGMFEYSLWDTGCKEGNVNASNFFDATAAELPTDQLDGSGTRVTSLMLDMKLDKMANSVVAYDYYIDGAQKATVEFCVRFGVYSSPSLEEVHEVNFEEVVLTLYVDLSDTGFVLIEEHDLIGKDEFDEEQDQSYGSEGFLCDYDGSEIPPNMADPLEPGSNFQLCVGPNDDAQNDGITMNQVESMEYVRTDENTGNKITQPAVVNGDEANNGLSTLVCRDNVCIMESILQLSMFDTKICDGPGVTAATDLEGNQLEPDPEADPDDLCADQVPAARRRRGLVLDNSQEILKQWLEESRKLGRKDMKINAGGVATLKFGSSRRHRSRRRILQEGGGITASRFNVQLEGLTFDDLEAVTDSIGDNEVQADEEESNKSNWLYYMLFGVGVGCMILITYTLTREKKSVASAEPSEDGAAFDLVDKENITPANSDGSVATTAMNEVSIRSASFRSTMPSVTTSAHTFDASTRSVPMMRSSQPMIGTTPFDLSTRSMRSSSQNIPQHMNQGRVHIPGTVMPNHVASNQLAHSMA